MAYNYRKFAASEYDISSFSSPAPGSPAPDFQLTAPDGSPARLLDFDTPFMVLETGSYTCPLYQGHRAAMDALAARFPNVTFTLLYVREAHPGATIPAHASITDKRAMARRLISTDHETRRVLVDALDGRAHRAYGGLPDMVFIINRHGCVVWRAEWNDVDATARALEAVCAGRPATSPAHFRPVSARLTWHILRRAGSGARWDYLRDVPRLAWKKLFHGKPSHPAATPRSIPPDIRCQDSQHEAQPDG